MEYCAQAIYFPVYITPQIVRYFSTSSTEKSFLLLRKLISDNSSSLSTNCTMLNEKLSFERKSFQMQSRQDNILGRKVYWLFFFASYYFEF